MGKQYEYLTITGEVLMAEPVISYYRRTDNLYVGLKFFDKGSGEAMGDTAATVSISRLPYMHSTIDIENNGPEMLGFLTDNGFGRLTGEAVASGFYSFPVFAFDVDAIKDIDPEQFEAYQKSQGVVPERQRLSVDVPVQLELIEGREGPFRYETEYRDGVEWHIAYKEADAAQAPFAGFALDKEGAAALVVPDRGLGQYMLTVSDEMVDFAKSLDEAIDRANEHIKSLPAQEIGRYPIKLEEDGDRPLGDLKREAKERAAMKGADAPKPSQGKTPER